jgi:glycosyltransferase involved in cell wall biosynthesis
MVLTEKSIAFVFSGLYVGGAEKFGITLANRFAADGIRTFFILFEKIDSPYYRLIHPEITLIHVERKSKYDLVFHKKFEKILEQHRISDVLFFCLKPLLLTRLFAGKKSTGTNFHITLHSTIPVNYKEYLRTRILLGFVKKSDKTIFICRNQRDYVGSRYGFKPIKHTVIYNGVDTSYFNPKKFNPAVNKREQMGIPQNHKIILLVATLRPEKGHRDAIRALKHLHTHFPGQQHTHLVCTGGGPADYMESLIRESESLGVKQYVHLEGNQPDVRPYFSVANLFTLTSVSVETFSIAALEAMSFGLPISLTRIGGAAEMVFEGINGNLSEPGNPASIAASWNELLSKPLNRDKIREKMIELFSLDKTFRAYRQYLDYPEQ